jgi:probable HAF family extracellular repeat protein
MLPSLRVTRRVAAVSIVALAAIRAGPAPAQSYTVVDLGTPGGFTISSGTYSEAHGINQSGSVAGEWAPNASSQRAFLSAGGTNTDIGFPAGTQFAMAYALNAANAVVGEGYNFVGSTYAFLYTNGVMTDLTPVIPSVSFPYSIAHAVNDTGRVAGESFVSASAIHAVIFQGNHAISDLGVLTNGDYSAAFGINNSNVIVGESTVSSGGVYAFVYSNSTMTSLGSLGGNYSAAFAINDAGQIAGESDNSSGETRAFLHQNGAMMDLGTLGGLNSSAAAINHAGLVVGYALTTNGDSHAFLFNGATMLDLNNLISHAVCTNLASANGINDAGQIAGSGYTPDGVLHAFVLTPVVTLAGPDILTNGQFQVTVQGLPGQQYVLQGSTNLLNWTPLATNTLVAAWTNWADSGFSNDNHRFYRLLTLP